MEMAERMPGRETEARFRLQHLKEDAAIRGQKKENRKKRRSILEEENERLRSLLRMSRIME